MRLSPRRLLPHQEEALSYCLATPNPALFMEMRLGKTKVVIEWLRNVRGKILVVCPLSTVRSWKEELEAELEPSPALLLGTTKERMEAFSHRRKWNLINFEGVVRCPSLLSDYRWDAMVIDESTRIKNPKAVITKLLVKYSGNADRRCILSGNPDPEGPLDFYEQFNFLHGGFMGFKNFWSYRNIAFFPLAQNYKWTVKPSFRAKITAAVQSRAFIRSRKQVGLANEKFYETRYIKMEPEQKKMMEKLESEFVLETPTETKQTNWVPVKLAWMARLAGGYTDGKKWFDSKFKELITLLCGELKNQRVVVWFRFNTELRRAETALKGIGVACASIDGTVDEADRADIRNRFRQAESGLRVLLIQGQVGMFGIDLSSASTAIYFSNHYSNEIRTQSEDRIEHPLKKEPLLIIDLVTEDTIDEDVVAALRKKRKESESYLFQEVADGIRRRASCLVSSR